MWKVLIFLACLATVHAVLSCDDETRPPPPTTKPTTKAPPVCSTAATTATPKPTTKAPPVCSTAPICKKNEEYSLCANGGCGPKICSEINGPRICVDPTICIKGCVCKQGYLRAENGTCVPKDKCPPRPPKCGRNEVYNNCSNTYNYRPTKCSELGYPLKDPKCKAGCACKDDNVRDDKGVCIPIKNCPSCGGDKHAESGCGNNCGRTCATYNKKQVICTLACKLNGCDCKKGYVYDPNQKRCVDPKDCTPTCKINEQYSDCINGGCGPRNCSQANDPIICIHPVLGGCFKGCICSEGYLRAKNGTCVPKDQCPPNPPKCCKNEIYNNCSNPDDCRPAKCSELGYPLNCNQTCKPGCICKEDYVRDDKGVCIPVKKCPCCGGDKNAESGCGNNCGKTCLTYLIKPPICSKQACIRNGCDCKDGYVYDSNQKCCVKPSECTPICKKNEEYSLCANGGCGPKNCSEINGPRICVDPTICIKGCVCKQGYLRAENGTCVPKDKCPPRPPKCGRNEVYNNCSNTYNYRPTKCSELGYPLKDPKCKAGCACKDDYVRDDKGVCIPIKNCPSCGGDKHAESGCGNNCGRTCATYNKKQVICTLACKLNGCDCKKGYVYDPNQKRCVDPKDCTPTCKINEQYSDCINGGCGPRNCSQANDPIICIHPVLGGCIKGCICSEGYLRAKNGTCVPKDQCPPNPPKCCKNEIYNNCSNPDDCRPAKCSELGYPLNCNQTCKPGCICKEDFVRDDKGVCIPVKTCPCCGGDKNAESGCGNNCGKTCLTYLIKPPICSKKACIRNGCDCKDGYVYDSNQKCCVKPSECTPICKKNEEYSPCANGGCGPKNCSEINGPRICVDPRICIKGCVCKQGYLRAENGTCVPKDKCPPKCGENEHYESCIITCGSQNCSDAGKVWHCPNLPEGKCFSSGCVCDYGYLRNASNVCIQQEKCPTPSCPPGQVWDWCPTVKCEGDYCMKTRDSPRSCPIGIVCSPPRCVCGYNSKIDRRTGECIPIPKCPPFKCGCNEEYQACSTNCPGERCSDLYNKRVCPKIGVVVNCAPECKCIKGFLRDENKNCIPACECPVTAPIQSS